MIFEGTKNEIFFGLGLTRAGTYLPPAEALLEMSELFGVSINELLSGKRLSYCYFWHMYGKIIQ